MDKVDEVSGANNWNDTRNGKYGKQGLQLQLQIRCYKNKYPVTKQEKAFNLLFLHQFFHRTITGIHLSIENLAILGFFFAMVFCEYVKATKIDRKKHMIRL